MDRPVRRAVSSRTGSPLRRRAAPGGWLLAASTGALLWAAPLLGGCGPPALPNLLLITVDTLRADRLACYGGEPDVGAAICSLAEKGTRFAWAVAPAPSTTPSVASILTSQYPAFHGVSQGIHFHLSDDATTLAEVLRSAGYSTAAVVSNPILERGRNFTQGFDLYDEPPEWRDRDAGATADAALAWARSGARPPWFLWVHFQDPHGPYQPPGAAEERDDPRERRLPVLSNDYGRNGIPAYQALPGLFTPGAYQRRYLAEIRYLDQHVDRLVAGLDALGHPPAVLLTADHGEAFGEDGYHFAHGHSVGLDQIRVPLLWRPTGSADAAIEEEPVSLLDVAPTLLGLAGIDPPESFQGRPLPGAGVAASGAGEEHAIFSEHRRRVAVVKGRRFYERGRSPRGQRLRGAIERPTRLPERTALLRGAGPLPPYEAVPEDRGARPLEATLARFLDATSDLPSAPRHEEVSETVRERLRALGYTE
jgi:arylsulfatase